MNKPAIITSAVILAGTAALLVVNNRNASRTVPPQHDDMVQDDRINGPGSQPTACPTARPLPPWAPPPASDYCTLPRFYLRYCETLPWTQMYQSIPGHTGQGCSAHTWIISGSDGFDYPIVDQGPNGIRYPRPPATAPEALAMWTDCWINHKPPGGGYDCSRVPVGGTLVYHPIPLSQVPDPPRSTFATIYGCCGTPAPTITPLPITPVPGSPTATPHVICIPVTVTPKVA